ncbi:hypothetical protein SLA2020_064540 [Shorea laevis]
MPQKKNFRKRSFKEEEEEEEGDQNNVSEDEVERRLVLEEVKFLQKQMERKSRIPDIIPTAQTGAAVVAKGTDKVEADGEKEELVLQDAFAQETAVMVEDPNI